jgi:hypothetical protein
MRNHSFSKRVNFERTIMLVNFGNSPMSQISTDLEDGLL